MALVWSSSLIGCVGCHRGGGRRGRPARGPRCRSPPAPRALDGGAGGGTRGHRRTRPGLDRLEEKARFGDSPARSLVDAPLPDIRRRSSPARTVREEAAELGQRVESKMHSACGAMLAAARAASAPTRRRVQVVDRVVEAADQVEAAVDGSSRMSATSIRTPGPAFAGQLRHRGGDSQAVTFQPCSIIGMKLLPVPQATSTRVALEPVRLSSLSSVPIQSR